MRDWEGPSTILPLSTLSIVSPLPHQLITAGLYPSLIFWVRAPKKKMFEDLRNPLRSRVHQVDIIRKIAASLHYTSLHIVRASSLSSSSSPFFLLIRIPSGSEEIGRDSTMMNVAEALKVWDDGMEQYFDELGISENREDFSRIPIMESLLPLLSLTSNEFFSNQSLLRIYTTSHGLFSRFR